jgi:ABC-type transport system involved in multi-copper enzyme maturation permease subunit
MGLAILYQEELRAIARGRFARLGAAVVLLGIGGLAAVSTQDTWLDGYGIIAYFLAPLAFIPLSAGAIASPRATRFVESLFTAPVERRDWLAAKVLVLLTLAAGYYLALLPMMAVYVAHVGMPLLLARFLAWTPGILLASVAVGTLIGVLFIGRSVAPPIGTGVGVLLAFAGLVPLQELLVAQGYGASASGRITLASPAVLLKNALGFTLGASAVPATTAMTWLSFLVVVAGAFALAAWVFLRAQGVESWEATPVRRWVIAAAILALVLLPILVADANYDSPAPAANRAPDIPHVFSRGGGILALVDPGAPPPASCCDMLLNRDAWPSLPTGETTRQDLLLLLPVDAGKGLASLRIQVRGESGLEASAQPGDPADLPRRLETHAYPADAAPMAPDGHRILKGWVARVPVSLTPRMPWDIGGNRYPLNATATYVVAGEGKEQNLSAAAAVVAQVPGALGEMAAAAAVLPLLCLLAALARWRRTQ